jgi:sugar lactone lactonase YvrE
MRVPPDRNAGFVRGFRTGSGQIPGQAAGSVAEVSGFEAFPASGLPGRRTSRCPIFEHTPRAPDYSPVRGYDPATMADLSFSPLPDSVPACLLGESPFWHPGEQSLYWVDIPGHALHRFTPSSGDHRQWALDGEPGCIAPLPGGCLYLAMRDGLYRFDTATGQRTRVAAPPYDPARQRFNDGKADPQGRLWVGTIDDQRLPEAALYCLVDEAMERRAGDVASSNGLAWSPDGHTQYWSDTKAHAIYAMDVDPAEGALSERRVFAQFPPKPADGSLAGYGGRPDGAAVDAEGAYWAAMFEGQRLVRLAPDGHVLQEIPLPVRCATMPCFGGPDLRTLYVTTAREKRPAEELAAQPWAGRVLQARVDVPGLPVNFAAD